MANQERVKLWNVRTTKMTDEMYNFVLDRISKTSEGTFREYAFQLIERDMQQQKNEQKNKEKDRHVHDELIALREEMTKEFRDLRKKIDQGSIYVEHKTADPKTASETIEEGQLITEKITGTIEEEYDYDF
ncbi:hypothetical protein ACJGE4_20685 (plasmid) [Bacillus velezensis]|uniref:Uncharacterized protein n=1 Tax=Bacillus velezensis TaxID=492670 RepID=A0ABC8DG31_BACVE|nr:MULTISPECIES: hypothetical protein [Bacillus amyloliquefaciens group]AVI31061.1 hypothetical protein C3Z10_21940 [Bacillus velezensis]AWX74613.1 hypothetical protein BVDSYZ_21450 [Bacillus velezensis]MDK2561832.1 hypothetical protein [Bacillus amyloliquefaciens]QWQ49724.1 hypothetical protein KOM03_19915 [Bacillus velezensis]QYC35381.1 hypothetical protein J5X95_20360 [Bacillus amyloliquefaciens]